MATQNYAYNVHHSMGATCTFAALIGNIFPGSNSVHLLQQALDQVLWNGVRHAESYVSKLIKDALSH
jgi:hypothetical protein